VITELLSLTEVETRRIHVDEGYRGHNYPAKLSVWLINDRMRSEMFPPMLQLDKMRAKISA
jgi:hypothetical protein